MKDVSMKFGIPNVFVLRFTALTGGDFCIYSDFTRKNMCFTKMICQKKQKRGILSIKLYVNTLTNKRMKLKCQYR